MNHRSFSLLAVLVSVALTATACANSLQAEDLLGSDFDDLDFDDSSAVGTNGPRSTGTGRQAPLVNGVRLIDDECYDDEARCGRAQLSQTTDSADRIEIAYRIVRDTGDNVPVVVLTRSTTLPSVDLDAFADRTVIEIGERGVWPSRPGLDCPEWNNVGADNDGIVAMTQACRDRLVNAGVAVGADDLSQRAADVVDLLGALGYAEADILAPARRAGLVPHIANSIEIRGVFYVDPYFDGTELFVNSAQRVRAALDFVWERCDADPGCATAGSVTDLFDAIAALDGDPVRPAGRDEIVIDEAVGLRMITNQLDDARTAAFLPELHRMLLARDADGLVAVLDSHYQPRDESGITLACDQTGDGVVDGPHPVLQNWADRGASLYADLCPIWFTDVGERAATVEPYLERAAVVTTSSWRPSLTDDVLHLIEPTVGRISEECIWTAAAAWFDRGEADAASCTATLEFTSRAEDIVATAGDYYYDDRTTVRLPVPEGWSDSGNGTWTRDADPLDGTLLDVWVRSEVGPEVARDVMIDSWALFEPTLETVEVDRREWFLATGPEFDTSNNFTYTIATATVDGQNVAVVLGSDDAEHADLRSRVLEPAMAGAAVLS